MGLGIVEILMDIEDEFDLEIPDQDAEHAFTTVGATVDYVVARLVERTKKETVCPSSRSFYRLRREVVSRFGIERRSVRTESRFVDIVPPRKRAQWKQIAAAAGIPRGRALFSDLLTDQFPGPNVTVRELLLQVTGRPLVRSDGIVDEREVDQRVRRIVSEVSGAAVETIGRTTRYADL